MDSMNVLVLGMEAWRGRARPLSQGNAY